MLGHASLSDEPTSSVRPSAQQGSVGLFASAKLDLSSFAQIDGRATLQSTALITRGGSAALLATAAVTITATVLRPNSARLTGRATVAARAGAVARGRSTLIVSASQLVLATTAFEDLLNNPNRRPIYTIEIEPWLLRPYEEAA